MLVRGKGWDRDRGGRWQGACWGVGKATAVDGQIHDFPGLPALQSSITGSHLTDAMGKGGEASGMEPRPQREE